MPPAIGVKFKATRDIAVDSVTGKFRKPNAAEIEKLVDDLQVMTKRPVATMRCYQYLPPLPAESPPQLDGQFGRVVLARPRADGSIETRCVFTFEEGAAFLGLVADDYEIRESANMSRERIPRSSARSP